MRRAILTLLLITAALSSCKREKTFDERYEAAESNIRNTAQEIDREVGEGAELESTSTASPPNGSPSR